MVTVRARRLRRCSRRALAVLLGYLSISALIGGTLLVVEPRGELIRLDPALLRGTGFPDYLLPGVVLFGVGVGAGVATFGAWRRRLWGPQAAIGMGVVLLVWLTVQGSLIGFGDALQLVHGALALAIILLGKASGACR